MGRLKMIHIVVFFLHTVNMEVLVRLKQMRFTLAFGWIMEGGLC